MHHVKGIMAWVESKTKEAILIHVHAYQNIFNIQYCEQESLVKTFVKKKVSSEFLLFL